MAVIKRTAVGRDDHPDAHLLKLAAEYRALEAIAGAWKGKESEFPEDLMDRLVALEEAIAESEAVTSQGALVKLWAEWLREGPDLALRLDGERLWALAGLRV